MAATSVFDPLCIPDATGVHQPRLGGGWRQRAVATESSNSYRDRSRSPLRPRRVCRKSLGRIEDWACGRSSAPHIWKHIDNAVADDRDDNKVSHPMLSKLHNCGVSQKDPHIHSRFSKLFMQQCGFDQCIDHIDDPASSVNSTILPSTIVKLLHTKPATFKQAFGADPVRVEAYWTSLFSTDDGQKYRDVHPHLAGKSPHDLRHTIPCTLHEDAAPYSKKGSDNNVSWQPILGSGTDFQQNYIFSSEIKQNKDGSGCYAAWEKFFRVWDAMAQGVDLDGNYVAHDIDTGIKWSFVMIFAKADCEQLARWGLPSYSDGDIICGFCHADRSDLPWSDVRSTGLWRWRPFTNDQFKARTKAGHPISASHYWNMYFPRLDPMHVLDHHGIACTFGGSVLEELLHDPRLGASQPVRMRTINASLKAYQDTYIVTSRLPPLRINNLSVMGWAELGGPVIKAANTRHSMPWIESIARQYFTSGSRYDKAKIDTVAHLNGVYHILFGSSERFLTDAQKVRLDEHLVKMAKYHLIAREEARLLRLNRWQVKPKAHYAQHLGEQSRLISSRHTMCYSEESMMGQMSNIWKGSCKGKYKNDVQRQVLLKYLIRFCIVFEL